jgi:hypothetical protein
MKNLASGDMTGWDKYLWYSRTVEDLMSKDLSEEQIMQRESQRGVLRHLGYTVAPIEGITGMDFADPVNWAAERAYKGFKAGGSEKWNDLKYFSDLARFIYIFSLGGIHMDVDIGVGALDPTQQYHHYDPEGEVPLMGTIARDEHDEIVSKLRYINRFRNERPTDAVSNLRYLEAVRDVTNQATAGSGMYNALIASRPNTRRMKLAIETYIAKMKGGLFPAMAINPILLGRTEGADLNKAMTSSVPPYLLSLEHITEESNF